MKKLRADHMQGTPASTWSKSFCLARSYVKKHKIKILKTIIWPVVIWVGTWSLALKEENILKAFENTAMRKMF
jgi:hypothetical protein